MQATIDIRLANLQKMDQGKFNRLLDIVAEQVEKAFPNTIVRVRPSVSNSDLSVFGLGKEGKQKVATFLEQLFEEGSAFDELQDEYY
ncbi:DinI-like family protein [Glaesserella parasuis]|uniref:DinI-like family protein n=1 Tax=Glaesserella parasuis TaxID=738 RepID=UPI00135D2E89|nr:DinI-like family protein [Glaesserella parasuis]MDG6230529.1 DinI-like family protein [Glaesserella parasuis]MDP0075314.1 DinI-like family protein [Glaesserella parasuis]MDP0089960.1 DinI-like family protein [Glaesserella parasuis]MDP0241075.1 DinI-like family protein [Glaesserella parasuis]MDP0321621.1 DinI-like family protein [Glaesserella parasuis]